MTPLSGAMRARFSDRRLTRKQREHVFRVNLVLDAARETFMEKPFAQVTVDEIAQRAELSIGTLYNLFSSKEQIYKNVISRVQDDFFEHLEQRLASIADPAEQIHTMITEYFRLFRENLQVWRFYVYATAGLNSDIRNELFAEVQETAAAFMETLASICAAGIESGAFRAGLPPELLAVAVHSVPHAFLSVIFESESDRTHELLPAAIEAVDRLLGRDALMDDAPDGAERA